MSDWVTSGIPTGRVHKYPLSCASGSIRAGNDIMIAGGGADCGFDEGAHGSGASLSVDKGRDAGVRV